MHAFSNYVSKMNLSIWKTRLRLYHYHGYALVSLLKMSKQFYTKNEGFTLITAHQSKGLEFDHVYLPGWEEGIFPSSRALEQNYCQQP